MKLPPRLWTSEATLMEVGMSMVLLSIKIFPVMSTDKAPSPSGVGAGMISLGGEVLDMLDIVVGQRAESREFFFFFGFCIPWQWD